MYYVISNSESIKSNQGITYVHIQLLAIQRLVEFAVGNGLAITNSLFLQLPRRRYTWLSTGERHRNQIVYILIQSRWKSSVTNVKTLPERDCGSDHNLLLAKIKIHLKAKRKGERPLPLKTRDMREFAQTLGNNIRAIPEDAFGEEPEVAWQHLKAAMLTARESTTRRNRNTIKNKEWMTEETWSAIRERKSLRRRGLGAMEREEYRDLSKEVRHLCKRDKNRHLQDKCGEIERSANREESRELFHKIKEITRNFKRCGRLKTIMAK